MRSDEIAKPRALVAGSAVRIISPASPVEEVKLRRGMTELERLGLRPRFNDAVLAREGYFAGEPETRAKDVAAALVEGDTQAVIASRGGYGCVYLLDALDRFDPARPKALVGFSDLTVLLSLVWHRWSWVTFYGPMVAAGFDYGADKPDGYDERSFRLALENTSCGWELPLEAESLVEGAGEGRIVGGCLTLVRALVGTEWEPDTNGAILLLEDCKMKPYQVDRALMHLKLAGKFDGVRAFLLGDFPGCEPASREEPGVRDVLLRLLAPYGVPIVWAAPVGHTRRPMLTIPLGVRARLESRGACRLEILEPAVLSA
jgi:muramoyltetrapeptide carboxypeptidase